MGSVCSVSWGGSTERTTVKFDNIRVISLCDKSYNYSPLFLRSLSMSLPIRSQGELVILLLMDFLESDGLADL